MILSELKAGDRVRLGYGYGEENYCIAVGRVTANAPERGMLLLL